MVFSLTDLELQEFARRFPSASDWFMALMRENEIARLRADASRIRSYMQDGLDTAEDRTYLT